MSLLSEFVASTKLQQLLNLELNSDNYTEGVGHD